MPRINKITIEEIKYVAHELAVKTMDWDEPIPKFETRYPNALESCITTPFMKFDKKLLYKGLVEKAAILFYLLIKNHPFQNGNKRIAVTSLFVFLNIKNNKWLKVDTKVLYRTAVWVAESPAEAKDEVVEYLIKFINRHLVDGLLHR
jgi:death-on-curing family protein